jgi:hypothetical protein
MTSNFCFGPPPPPPPPTGQLIGCNGPASHPFPFTPSGIRHTADLDFVGALTVAGKPFKEIEETVKKVYGDKALKKTQLYEIIHKVKEGKLAADQGLFNGKRRIRDPTFIAAQVADDRRVTV